MVEYWLEIVLGMAGIITGLVISRLATTDTAIIIGILMPVIAIAVVMIRMSIVRTLLHLQSNVLNVAASSREIVEKMADMDGIEFQHAKRQLDAFLTRMREIHSGRIFLTMPEYFNISLAGIGEHDSGDTIYAVNSKNGLRWKTDPQQQLYKDANFAAARRGAVIHRVFIINRQEDNSDSLDELEVIIKEHFDKDNIHAYIVTREILERLGIVHECDWVYLEKPFRQVLVDYTDSIDPIRGSHAYILTKDGEIDNKLKYFHELVRLKAGKESFAWLPSSL